MEAIAEDGRDLDAIYDLLPIGVMALNREGQVTIWNQQMATWTGVSRTRIINERLGAVVDGLDDAKFSGHLNAIFDTGFTVKLHAQLHGQVIPLRLPDGGDRVHQATVVPVAGVDGRT